VFLRLAVSARDILAARRGTVTIDVLGIGNALACRAPGYVESGALCDSLLRPLHHLKTTQHTGPVWEAIFLQRGRFEFLLHWGWIVNAQRTCFQDEWLFFSVELAFRHAFALPHVHYLVNGDVLRYLCLHERRGVGRRSRRAGHAHTKRE
jgi:hypothetical protein